MEVADGFPFNLEQKLEDHFLLFFRRTQELDSDRTVAFPDHHRMYDRQPQVRKNQKGRTEDLADLKQVQMFFADFEASAPGAEVIHL